MTNKEQLAILITDIKYIKEQLNDHLHSHFKYSIMAWTVAFSAILTLLGIVLKTL